LKAADLKLKKTARKLKLATIYQAKFGPARTELRRQAVKILMA
jgi:hypothetical protein